MILSIVVILMIAVVAYWHYVQGLFSSTLSAICAILAAALAFSYHEVVVMSLLGGKMADQANALVLVALFALIFLILRIIFDSTVPGNLRFPSTLDKVGGAIMGAIVGIFGSGILVIAMQTLPFGPEIAGYSRYQLAGEIEVQVSGERQAQDLVVHDSLKSPRDFTDPDGFVDADRGSLWVPVDDIVINVVNMLGNNSLSTTHPLDSIHPAYLDEMFANRLGIQSGARHVAVNLPGREQVKVDGVFLLSSVPTAEFEIDDITSKIKSGRPKLPGTIKPKPAEALLVIRTVFTANATDTDRNARFSPGSIRLVAAGKNYTPLGVLDPKAILRVTQPDDFIFVTADGAADLVFLIQRADVLAGAAPAAKGAKAPAGAAFKPGVFLSVKRLANIDLSASSAESNYSSSENMKVLQKKDLPAPKDASAAVSAGPPRKTAGGAAPPVAQPAADAKTMPLELTGATISDEFPNPINTAAHQPDAEVTFEGGTMTTKANGAAKIEIAAPVSLATISAGDFLVKNFNLPAGFKVVQVQGQPAARDADPWRFADELGSIELGDANSKRYKPAGVWVKLKLAEDDKIVVTYHAGEEMKSFSRVDGRPTDVWLFYVIADGTQLSELTYNGKRVRPFETVVQ